MPMWMLAIVCIVAPIIIGLVALAIALEIRERREGDAEAQHADAFADFDRQLAAMIKPFPESLP